jgi:hypothetical protein
LENDRWRRLDAGSIVNRRAVWLTVPFVLVALGLGGCHAGRRSAGGGPNLDGGATPAAWATWPMPNSTPGLPHPQSFDIGRNEVAVDGITGLMWQRNSLGTPTSFAGAKQACDQLALAGYDDWRLPARIELVSILDLGRIEPAIDPVVFPETPSDWFWTSSVAAGDGQSGWYVYFYFGYPKTDLLSNSFSWRCVRTAAIHPGPLARYDIQAGTVRDLGTGLLWQRSAPNRTFTFDDARTYCTELSLAAQQGWRLPSMTELLTLIDEGAAKAPMIDATAFPNTPSEAFWSSSEFGGASGMAWQVYFDRGNGLYGLSTAQLRVRCLR